MMMNSGVILTPSTSPPSSSSSFHPNSPSIFLSFSNYPIVNLHHRHRRICVSPSSSRPTTRFYCSSSPGSPGSGGESDNRTVLDAFFLGKALGEALTERIESTVGEVLSNIGRLQAEQQKQIQEFQEDVLERAKKAKEKAAREALQEQGRLIPSSTKEENEPVINGAGPSSGSTAPVTSSPVASVDTNQNNSASSVNEDPSDYVTRIQIDE